jgi:hypothetical protein
VSARVGISIRRNACAAVVVRRGRIRWRESAEREANAPIAPALTALLARMPLRRRGRVAVGIALGASDSQVKRITGLPQSMRADAAARLVRENASSFFLRSSPRLATTGVEPAGDGPSWCAALDGSLVDELVHVLRGAGFKALVFLPEALGVAMIAKPGGHRIDDGDVAAEFSTDERRAFTRFTRIAYEESRATPPDDGELPAALRTLGENARRYAAALGAASRMGDRALVWRPPPDPRSMRRWRRVRLVASATLLAASAISALIAPGVRASRDAAAAITLADRRRVSGVDASRTESQLRRITASLDRVERFESRRGDLPLLLGELARMLPDSTAMLSVRIDTVEVNVSVLTAHAADVVAELANVAGVASPRIVGSVVRDASTRVALERATIRFRHRRP